MKYVDALEEGEKCTHTAVMRIGNESGFYDDGFEVLCYLKVLRGDADMSCDGDSAGNCAEKK